LPDGGGPHGGRPDDALVSVIVPTRDRPRSLERCLEALERQSYQPLEIVVVDDGSEADGEVAAIVGRHGARLVRGAGRGPAAARNAGVGTTDGAFLCFTDDDCEPERDWAERLVQRLRAGADAVAGATLAGGGAIATASELAARAPTGGRVLALEPEARIVHRQRLTARSFLRQQARYGRGAFRFRRRGGEHRPLESVGFYAALVREGFRHGARVGLLLAAAQSATALGYAGGWWEASAVGRTINRRRGASSGARGA
jgi:glycosyltransferase involved in cell wall biosynthesis